MKILVAFLVLQIDEVASVIGPLIGSDAPFAIIGDRLRILRRVAWADPDIEHAIDGGEPRKQTAVRADLGGNLARIAEQVRSRDQDVRHVALASSCFK